MSKLRDLLYLLPQMWHALIHRPLTVRFPFAPPEIPEGFRGIVSLDVDLCRGCGLCVRDCPADALTLERESRDHFRILFHPERCAYCGQCEQSCNFRAISLTNDFTRATSNPKSLAIVLVQRGDEAQCQGKSQPD